jgi:rhamnosyltransferase subunit B
VTVARVLLVTQFTDGDVLPFVRIGHELRRRGHDVALLAPAPYADNGLEFVPVSSAEEYQRQLRDSPELLEGSNPAGIAEFYRRHALIDEMRREVRALVRLARPGDTILVGRHTTSLSVLIAAEVLDAPALWVAVTPIQYLTAPLAVVNLGQVLREGVARVRAEFGLAPVTDWAAWFSSARRHVGLWPDWFDRAGPPAPAFARLTGFVPAESTGALPEGTSRLLDGPVAPVLVTGGTGRMLHRRFYEAALAGVRMVGRPALVVTRHRDLVPDADDVHWAPWLPFDEVFPRVAAVVHHGGIGTLGRGLACGTPQLLLAHGYDRPDNGARLARLGLAAWLPPAEWTPSRVATSLAEIVRAGRVVPPEAPDGTSAAADEIEALAADRQRMEGLRPAAVQAAADRIGALPPHRRAALARLRAARSEKAR